MSFSEDHARMAQGFADERKLDDEQEQRSTIIGDVDGHWLIRQLETLWRADYPVRTERAMRFSFLAEGKEAVLSQLSAVDTAVSIEMPAGSIVRKVAGADFDSWVFQVDNGYNGADREWFAVAYRAIETGDHLLYLKSHHRRRTSR